MARNTSDPSPGLADTLPHITLAVARLCQTAARGQPATHTHSGRHVHQGGALDILRA